MAPRPSRVPLVALAIAVMAVSACGSGLSARQLASTPAWFKAKQKEIASQDYPDLASIPDPAVATQSDGRWRAVEEELLVEGAAIDASPRAAPAPPEAAAVEAFESEARGAVENARPK
ncbi:MAG: hypothetical protein JNM47_01990 [Hyphomonadaceae bacterium]|nr:hypothetical protein [Hyphomonadaceae bacterium]